jgi:hypothetical protein
MATTTTTIRHHYHHLPSPPPPPSAITTITAAIKSCHGAHKTTRCGRIRRVQRERVVRWSG